MPKNSIIILLKPLTSTMREKEGSWDDEKAVRSRHHAADTGALLLCGNRHTLSLFGQTHTLSDRKPAPKCFGCRLFLWLFTEQHICPTVFIGKNRNAVFTYNINRK